MYCRQKDLALVQQAVEQAKQQYAQTMAAASNGGKAAAAVQVSISQQQWLPETWYVLIMLEFCTYVDSISLYII